MWTCLLAFEGEEGECLRRYLKDALEEEDADRLCAEGLDLRPGVLDGDDGDGGHRAVVWDGGTV